MATGMFSGVPSPNRSVLDAQQLQRPAEPYLRQQYPELYGALGGFMGMAPDEMSGSIFDPNTARVRAGAEYGFPVGTAAQVIPAVGLLAPVVKAGARALGPTAVGMGERYLQRQGLMPGVVEGESVGMLGGPIKPQAPVSELGFYSATEQAALNLPRKSGTGESFLNDLMKGQDVKKDELSWMGLDDYLKGKPNVTRQEVQDFIANNRVDVRERQLGAAVAEDPVGIAQRKAVFDKYEPQIQALYKEIDQYETNTINARNLASKNETEAIAALNREGNPQPIPTTDDWNRYYAAKAEMERVNKIPLDSREYVRKLDELVRARDAEANAAYVIPEPTPTRYQNYQLPGGENYREILLTLPAAGEDVQKLNQISMQLHGKPYTEIMADTSEMAKMRLAVKREYKNQFGESGQNAQDRGMYRSSHFNEPNILAHMRVNDRVDADGKKMLLIEEIQSDWHQAGREKGYQSANSVKAKQAFTDYSNELANKYNLNPEQNLSMYATMKGMKPEEVAKYDQLQSAWISTKEGVPDAPFKDTWHQLALKRALKYAADNGYDRVGLTTGRQQAERYDLSKHVQDLTLHGTGDNLRLSATAADGRNKVIDMQHVTPETLPNYIGKEAAQKLLSQPEPNINNPYATRNLFGLDLQVGGEGMKKYYDEIYPAFFAKQGKKYNAKTGETRIPTGRSNVGGMPSMYPDKETIRYIDISPEMRGGVKKGQPLFTAAPIGGIGLGAGTQDNEMPDAVRQYMADPRYSDPFADTTR